MGRAALSEVEQVVERFLASRRAGRRPSIDEVMAAGEPPPNAGELRAGALIELAERARAGGAPSSAIDSPFAIRGDEPFPELEGYDIVDRVGVGGMGVVYEAYQRATGRRVAVKCMHSGARLNETARRRFEREVELIARLQHPNIAAIIDSGIDRGGYYYVMEYVDGRALDEALPPGAAAPGDVLRRLAMIADAVDYAHQRGVLHRDLKPSNVLIDEQGGVHLLDFGLAKALEADAARPADRTLSQPGQLLGTLGYMSPEQCRAEPELVSVRSDVYALGAIAYELLTGRLPCSIEGPLDDVLERITRREPPAPSTLRGGLNRDLDAVVLKALEKDPDRRYATAAGFGDDLRACLESRPVGARRIGVVGRGRRWVRRNRTLASISAAAVVVVFAIGGVAFDRIADARARTIQRGRQAQRTVAAMQEMLAAGDPERVRGVDVTLREKLDDWEAALADYEREPLMEASLRGVLGRLALQYGEYDRAARNLRRAVALLESADGEAGELADAVFALAGALHKQSRYAEAESHYRRALELRREVFGPRAPEVVESLNGYAWVLKDQDRLAEAERIYRDALDILAESREDVRELLAATEQNLAQLLTRQSRYEEAERLFRDALELRRALYGPEHQHVASTLATLGSMLRENGDLVGAEPQLREALEMRVRLLGPEHPSTIVSMNLLGLLLRDLGRLDEAESLLRDALELRIAALGTRVHDFVAVSQYNLATVLVANGAPADAERLLREALAVWSEVLPDFEHHHKAAYGWYSLAETLLELGERDAARVWCDRAAALRLTMYPDGAHPEIAQAMLLSARISLAEGDARSAEAEARVAWEILRTLPYGHRWRVRGRWELGECLVALGRWDEAERTLRDGFEEGELQIGVDHPDLQRVVRALAALYETRSQPEEAEEFRAMLRRSTPPNGE